MSWLNSLSDHARDRVFAWMRTWGETAQNHQATSRELMPQTGRIDIGGAWFDPFLSAEIATQFLSALRRGATPEDAATLAKTHGRECVKKFNERRRQQFKKTDRIMGPSVTERWEEQDHTRADHMARVLIREVKEADGAST